MAAPAVKETPKSPEPTLILPPAPAPPKMYWMGTTLDAPVHVLHLGGFEFQRFHQRPVPRQDKPEISTLTGPYRGNYKHLAADEVDRIREAAKTRVVRWGQPRLDEKTREPVIDKESGKPIRRGRIYDTRGSSEGRFKPEAGDKPIGNYFFLVPVTEIDRESLIPGARIQEPPTFYEMWERTDRKA